MGLGVSSSVLAVKSVTENIATFTVSSTAQFFDLSYTFGEDFTLQIIMSSLIGGDFTVDSFSGETVTTGNLTLTYNDLKYSNVTSTGGAWGINLGYDFGGIEVLLGVRNETILHDYTQSLTSTLTNSAASTTVTSTADTELTGAELHRQTTNVGIGFTF